MVVVVSTRILLRVKSGMRNATINVKLPYAQEPKLQELFIIVLYSWIHVKISTRVRFGGIQNVNDSICVRRCRRVFQKNSC